MITSIAFLLHLVGFGVLCASLIGGFILDRTLRSQTDFNLKRYAARIARTIGLLSPVAAILLLASGIGNIHNRYLASTLTWFGEGWLVAKLILFAVLVLNGVIYGPQLTRNRLNLIKALAEESAPPNAEGLMRSYNNQLTLFYIVQTLFLLLILFLSVIGPGKHSGVI